MRTCVLCLLVWMNILHIVKSKREPSPAVQKLKATCKETATCPVSYAEDELKDKLTPLQYRVTQERGTERPFSGEFLHKKDEGTYRCVVCGNRIFSSEHKYNSNSGWPAFSDVVSHKTVTLKDDTSHGMNRVEVTCSRCGAHLGHVFEDGPLPTGKRYCINSAAIDFLPAKAVNQEKLKSEL